MQCFQGTQRFVFSGRADAFQMQKDHFQMQSRCIDIVVILIADTIHGNITVRCISGQCAYLTALEQSKEIADVLVYGVVLSDTIRLLCRKSEEDGAELFYVFVIRSSLRSQTVTEEGQEHHHSNLQPSGSFRYSSVTVGTALAERIPQVFEVLFQDGGEMLRIT